jgi:hypothetical protein
MSLDYIWEKLYVAVDTLAASSGSIQERLEGAYISALVRLEPKDFQGELRSRFVALTAALTSGPAAPAGNQGTVAAATRALSDERAAELAHEIVSMFDVVAKLQGKAED